MQHTFHPHLYITQYPATSIQNIPIHCKEVQLNFPEQISHISNKELQLYLQDLSHEFLHKQKTTQHHTVHIYDGKELIKYS